MSGMEAFNLLLGRATSKYSNVRMFTRSENFHKSWRTGNRDSLRQEAGPLAPRTCGTYPGPA
jgi:hypothetical protein